jgi:EmrB/QacA subfamily drug resistance transporter
MSAAASPIARSEARDGLRTSPNKILAVMSGGLAVVVAAAAMLNVGLPDLARTTGATQNEALWIVNAYALVFAALLLPAAALGDIIGRRRAFVGGLAIFGGFSAATALVSDPTVLIALRALAGVGAALVMPVSLTIVTASFSEEERGRAVGVWSGVAGGAGTIGLIIAGSMLELFDWTSIFWFGAAVSALTLVATLFFVPDSRDENAPAFDPIGTLSSVVGLGGLVYAIIEQPEKGWEDPGVVTGLIAAVVGLTLFVAWETRRERPMLNPRLFTERAFSTGTLSVALQFAAAFGLFVIIFQYLQFTLGYSTLEAGAAVVPQGLGIMATAVLSDKAARKIGLGYTGAIGLAVLAGGFILLAVLSDVTSSYWALLPGLLVAGAGLGLASAAGTTSIMQGAPEHEQASASGVNNAGREVGGAIGIAAMGSVLNSTYSNNVNTNGLPDSAAHAAGDSIVGAQQIASSLGAKGTDLAVSAQGAFVDGFHAALYLGAGGLGLAAVILLVFGPRVTRADADEPVAKPVEEGAVSA